MSLGREQGLQHLWTPGSRLRVKPWHCVAAQGCVAHCSASRGILGSLMSPEHSCPGSKQRLYEDGRDEAVRYRLLPEALPLPRDLL